jgi:hypothetical protein
MSRRGPDIAQFAQQSSAKVEGTTRTDALRQRAKECRKAGLYAAAATLEREADRRDQQ